jgi:hypothetical protein
VDSLQAEVVWTRLLYAEAAGRTRRAQRQNRIVYAGIIVSLILLSILLFGLID